MAARGGRDMRSGRSRTSGLGGSSDEDDVIYGVGRGKGRSVTFARSTVIVRPAHFYRRGSSHGEGGDT